MNVKQLIVFLCGLLVLICMGIYTPRRIIPFAYGDPIGTETRYLPLPVYIEYYTLNFSRLIVQLIVVFTITVFFILLFRNKRRSDTE